MENNTATIKEMTPSPQIKRPTLSDPKEFAIIKNVYFGRSSLPDEKEAAENIERARARRKNFSNQSR